MSETKHKFRIPGLLTLIEDAFHFFSNNAWRIVSVLLLNVAVMIIPLITLLGLYVSFFGILGIGGNISPETGNAARIVLGVFGVILVFLFILWGFVSNIAMYEVILHGKRIKFSEVYKRAFNLKLLFRYAVGSLLAAVIMLVGYALLLVPGIYLSIPLLFWPFILIKEKLGVIDSFKRALSLVRGYWWVIFIRSGLMLLVATVVTMTASFFVIWITSAFGAILGLFSTIINPVLLIPITIGATIVGFLLIFLVQYVFLNAIVISFYKDLYERISKAKASRKDAKHKLSVGEKFQAVFVVLMFVGFIALQSLPIFTFIFTKALNDNRFDSQMEARTFKQELFSELISN